MLFVLIAIHCKFSSAKIVYLTNPSCPFPEILNDFLYTLFFKQILIR